jgi:dihydroorotate dehydrogenase
MVSLYRSLLRPLLFHADAETAHALGATALGLVHRAPPLAAAVRAALAPPASPSLAVSALGIHLAHPFGIAAGFDKGATLYNGLGALGWSFVEVGTVTAHAQPGNDRPRLFRLPEDGALLNRMGFNNAGMAAVSARLARCPPRGVAVGVNLGKSKVTALDAAPAEYASLARTLAPHAAYLVVNVSSPNTPGLRSLQSVDALAAIVTAVRGALDDAPKRPPVLVKIAPDLADEDIDAVVDLCRAEGVAGVAGVVATNTTLSRQGLRTPGVEALGAGGISGAPLRQRADAVIARVRRRAGDGLVVVGVGGVRTADDAWDKLVAGATLVQVYTGFVYEGPGLVARLVEGVARRMAAEGVPTLDALRARAGAEAGR